MRNARQCTQSYEGLYGRHMGWSAGEPELTGRGMGGWMSGALSLEVMAWTVVLRKDSRVGIC